MPLFHQGGSTIEPRRNRPPFGRARFCKLRCALSSWSTHSEEHYAGGNEEMVRSNMRPLVIAGPTASGKSKLALRLAAKFNGEIICADSRQFYAGMAIGTACPSNEEQAMIPHHGYGMLDPQSQRMDAGCFVKFAREKIDEINKRGKRPILVGGGGLYLRALRY